MAYSDGVTRRAFLAAAAGMGATFSARQASNRELAPHLSFLDMGGGQIALLKRALLATTR